ncbi:MAG: CoA transferase [Alphaproteobacteria bacterium]|nr:MAG: CoA transferase [Alphaproteobacteria bacterium]
MTTISDDTPGNRTGSPGPLSGIRVLDLSAYIAAPFGCTLLADQGADVVKIEAPTGDNLRNYPSTLEQESRAFIGLNRSKLGLVLDLKAPEGLAALLRLVRKADVLVHNFRPGVSEKLGIDYDRLQQINPRLIYCAVSGFGESGPLKQKAGFDQLLQVMTGMCSMQGKRGGKPEIIYGSVVDYYAAALVAGGVSSALFERERSGKGQMVSVSLLRSAMTMQSARLVWAEGEPKDIERDFRSGGVSGIHPTRDGYLYLSANTDNFWNSLCSKVDLPSLAGNERYDSVRKRAEHASEIVPLLHEKLRSRSALEWEDFLGNDVPCAAAKTVEDLFHNPQVLAEDILTDFDHPLIGPYRGMSKAIKFSRTPGPEPFAAPTMGQHSDAVLEEAGCSREDLVELHQKGIIR